MKKKVHDLSTITSTLAALGQNFEVYCHTRGVRYWDDDGHIAYVRCYDTPVGWPEIVDRLVGAKLINSDRARPYWEWCCKVEGLK